MKLINLLLIFIILLLNIGCEEDSSNDTYGYIIARKLRLSYISNENVDLLDTVNNVAYTNIEVYQLDGNRKKEVFNFIAPSSKTVLPYCYLSFNIENDNAYYLKLNESETDTVFGIIEKVPNGETLAKIVYNNIEKTLEDSTGVYKIVK